MSRACRLFVEPGGVAIVFSYRAREAAAARNRSAWEVIGPGGSGEPSDVRSCSPIARGGGGGWGGFRRELVVCDGAGGFYAGNGVRGVVGGIDGLSAAVLESPHAAWGGDPAHRNKARQEARLGASPASVGTQAQDSCEKP